MIKIYGVVQAVGFRPFVYNLAVSKGVDGLVYNDGNGVIVYAQANIKVVDDFIKDIKKHSPPLSKITNIEIINKKELKDYKGFYIKKSVATRSSKTIIPYDVSICDECKKELFNKNDRRYLYPFINCVNCGPRYTIIKNLPYDRKNTSMSIFKMCDECKKEYSNPSNRRYHAQPIGCFNCGPKISLLDSELNKIARVGDAISKACDAIKDGHIIAIKGTGGFNLVCDAKNDDTLMLLREKKRRKLKPFAVMLESIEEIKKIVSSISSTQKNMLSSKERPIVLMQKNDFTDKLLSKYIAPDIGNIGVFLPHSPLYFLILSQIKSPIVVTSANITSEPICKNIQELKARLDGISSYILDYNREIINSCDDSVYSCVYKKSIAIRKARGFSPASIELPYFIDRKTLAIGANQKNTITIAFGKTAVLYPHIGDLANVKSYNLFKKTISDIKNIYGHVFETIICDKHPLYLSTKWAKMQNSQVIQVQHHYAHILSTMLEYSLINQDVLGVAFDGSGYGDDKNIWGGEFLKSSFSGYERVFHFDYFKLIGGELAIREPRRVALSILFDLYGEDALKLKHCKSIDSFSDYEKRYLYEAYKTQINTPLTSSLGRIFDGVASIAGLCQKTDFDGQSGLIMEQYYDSSIKRSYDFKLNNKTIYFKNIFEDMLLDNNPTLIISKFFNTIVAIIEAVVDIYPMPLALSGGVFQNKILLKLLLDRFVKTLFIPQKVPINDGGLSFGQIGVCVKTL